MMRSLGYVLVATTVFAVGCKEKQATEEQAPEEAAEDAAAADDEEEASEETLYERLGGVYAIATVVDDFLDRVNENETLNANPAIDKARKSMPLPGLKFALTQMVAEATGGPQEYTGRAMPESHAHLNIGETEWEALAADFKASLDEFEVPEAEQQELFEIVGSVKPAVMAPEEVPDEPIESWQEGHAGEDDSLYERLGRVYAIAAVVDDFLDRVNENETLNANPAINQARQEVPLPGLKYMVTEFVAANIGGPQTYTGRAMDESHAHLNISQSEWDALVADLQASLNEFDVPEKLQGELLEVLGTTHGDIVLRPDE